MKKRRGLSIIITVMILIGLSLSTIAGIFLWTKNYSSGVEKQLTSEELCSKIVFNLEDFCYHNQMIYNVETEVYEQAANLKFMVKNNLDSLEIYGFLISVIDSKGNSRTISTLQFNEVQELEFKQMTTDFIPDIRNTVELKILPQLNNSGKIIPCNNQEKTTNFGRIREC